jgi:rhamnosyltransferase
MNQSICAVIVTHNIGKSVLETLRASAANAGYCVVVDNASTDDTVTIIRRYIEEEGMAGACEVIEHSVNNLARAQNIGIRRAREKGADWVLLLDHDSTPDAHMVTEMLAAYETHPAGYQVAMVVPNLLDKHSVRRARYSRHIGRLIAYRSGFGSRPVLENVMVAIASGSLIPMHTLETIGAMDEAFCIDNVDYDFSLRIIRSGGKILAVRDAVLHHALGFCRDHTLARLRVTTTNHSPMRRYYIYRNRLRLWRKHGLAVPAFVLLDMCAIGFDVFKILCLEEHKRAKFRAMFSGMRAAFQPAGRADLLPDDVAAAIAAR